MSVPVVIGVDTLPFSGSRTISELFGGTIPARRGLIVSGLFGRRKVVAKSKANRQRAVVENVWRLSFLTQLAPGTRLRKRVL